MATISFSSDFMFGTAPNAFTRITQIGDTANSELGTVHRLVGAFITNLSGGANAGELVIMSGTMPASASGLTSTTAPVGTTQLVSFNVNQLGASHSGSVLTFSTPYVAATASGTASWFWYRTRATLSSGYNGTAVYQSIIGSIGEPGSGADLEVASTSIVSGNVYRIFRLRFTLPTISTY